MNKAIFTPEFFNVMANVLGTLQKSIEDLGPALQDLVITLVTEFAANLPVIVELLESMIKLGADLIPSLRVYVSLFSAIAKFLTLLGESGLMVVVHFMMLNKVMGLQNALLTTWSMKLKLAVGGLTAYKVSILNTQMAFASLNMVMGAVASTLMLMTAQTAEERTAFAALVGITWALTGAQIALALAKTAGMTGPAALVTVPLVGAIIGAGLAAIPAMISMAQASLQHGTDYVPSTGLYMLHRGEAVIPASENRYSGGIHGGSFNFNFYDSSKDDFDYIMMRYGK
jgi:hypothetical protein